MDQQISYKLLEEIRTIIGEHVDPVVQKLDTMNEHYCNIRNDVKKNTTFRNQMSVWLTVAGFTISGVFSLFYIYINTVI